LTAPVGGSTFTAPGTIALAATASDSDGSVAKVEFYAGTTLLGTDTTSPFTYTWSGAAAGAYALKAVATDNSGSSTQSALVNITVTAVANLAPYVSLISPTAGSSFTAPATVALIAQAGDQDGSIQRVDFYNGSTLLGSTTTSPYTFNWLSVPAGSYSLSAVARDNLGGTTVSSWSNITVGTAVTLSKAVFRPAVVSGGIEYYVIEIFAAGADPRVATPIATQNVGLPAVVSGECTVDVRSTITALAPGNYIATVAAVTTTSGTLRSASFAFSR
jgi:hypothetical protein